MPRRAFTGAGAQIATLPPHSRRAARGCWKRQCRGTRPHACAQRLHRAAAAARYVALLCAGGYGGGEHCCSAAGGTRPGHGGPVPRGWCRDISGRPEGRSECECRAAGATGVASVATPPGVSGTAISAAHLNLPQEILSDSADAQSARGFAGADAACGRCRWGGRPTVGLVIE